MKLSAKAIVSFSNVNMLIFGNQWGVRAGDPMNLHFQLTDLDQSSLRYIPGIGVSNQPASITVTFPSIQPSKVITATAVQDPNDGSIWSVSLSPTQIPNSGNVIFSVTEGAAVRSFSVLNMISVEMPFADGCC